jgi:rRNA maturation RNase YbeY
MMTKFPEPDIDSSSPKLEIFNPSGYTLPFQESDAQTLLDLIEKGESVQFNSVEIVFTDESGIIEINSEYLNRDYVTDIISFRLDDDDSNQAIEGTLYCCAPRIAEQSGEFNSDPESEFLRIIVHGLLHLTGYDDQTDSDKSAMTLLEDKYLQSLSS